jgi:hypothetical protein
MAMVRWNFQMAPNLKVNGQMIKCTAKDNSLILKARCYKQSGEMDLKMDQEKLSHH